MAYPQTAPVSPLGVPVRGMNTRDPLANMSPEYAPWVLNMEPEPQYLRVRNGYVIHSNLSAVADVIYGLVSYGYENLFAYCYKAASNHKVYDVTYGDWVAGRAYAVGERVRGVTSNHIYNCTTAITESDTEPTRTGAGTDADDDGVWTWVKAALVHTVTGATTGIPGLPTTFRSSAGFLGPNAPATTSAIYNGSAWAALGFTHDPGTGAATISAVTTTNYRGRVYLFNDHYLYYSTLLAVAGACARIDLSNLIDSPEGIVWSGVLVDSTNKPTESMIAFGTSDGETYVFAGDDPGATNWEMVAKIKHAPVLNYQCSLEVRGDLWIATATGIISLRKAMTLGGDRFDDISVSTPIDPYFRRVVQAQVAEYAAYSWSWLQLPLQATMAYWPEQNKVYVATWGWLDVNGEPSPVVAYGTVFVCNLYTGAWAIHQTSVNAANAMIEPKYLEYFNNNIFYVSPTKYIYKVGAGYKDQGTAAFAAIPYALHSAYIPGKKDQNQVIGFEPLMKTDFTGSSVTIKAAADFGRKVSAASSQALLAAGGHQNPTYRVGVDGKFYQYRLEGNSDVNSTTGLELYNMGVAVK